MQFLFFLKPFDNRHILGIRQKHDFYNINMQALMASIIHYIMHHFSYNRYRLITTAIFIFSEPFDNRHILGIRQKHDCYNVNIQALMALISIFTGLELLFRGCIL